MTGLTPKRRAEMAEELRRFTLNTHDDLSAKLVEAEQSNDKDEVKQLRRLLKRNQKLIDDYGFKRGKGDK